MNAINPSQPATVLERIELSGVAIDSLTEHQTCHRILESLNQGLGGFVVTVNLDHLVRCQRQPEYLRLVQSADLVVADGMPLVWASRLQGTPLPERVAGSTVSWHLAEHLAEQGRSLFLLGGDPGVAERAAEKLVERFPKLKIAGVFSPAFGFERDTQAQEEIRQRLRSAAPDVVYVALGSPKQENLIVNLRQDLPGTWWLGVGISLSFITGDVQRAPVWLQRIGLEWVHRLAQEPRRLFRRYLIDGIPFAIRLFASSFAVRLTRRHHRSRD
jgi:N-acetylglucosaminyldiphosphoundecaprenol N-acetyl-beta-D-mannosaminyltransferase